MSVLREASTSVLTPAGGALAAHTTLMSPSAAPPSLSTLTQSDWWEDAATGRGVWRSTTTTPGALFVMTIGL